MLTDKNKDSFCPALWQDLIFDPPHNWCYACCKSEVIPMDQGHKLEERRHNSLTGIRDPGCNYCWNIEDTGSQSLRHFKLEKWNGDLLCRKLELILDNLCNLQCTYCNTGNSSTWATDERKHGKIKMIYDTHVYYSSTHQNDVGTQDYIDSINDTKPRVLSFSGGEPLINKKLCDILDNSNVANINRIEIATNLNYNSTVVIDKVLSYQNTHKITISPSLDLRGPVQEYIRYGFDTARFEKNLQFLLDNTNVSIRFLSLITAQSIHGFVELSNYIQGLKKEYIDRIAWNFSYCVTPANHSFKVLQQHEKDDYIQQLSNVIVDDKREAANIKTVIGALHAAQYDAALRKDQQHFFKQVNERHNIETPKELKFLIDDEVK